jgi:hypothetical protein
MATQDCGAYAATVQAARRAGQNLSEEIWGPDGPPCDSSIDEIEEFAVQASKGIFDGVIARALELQNQRLAKQLACPDCQQPCDVRLKSRTIIGRRAEATIQEPVCHCPVCDRDFFPAAGSLAAR